MVRHGALRGEKFKDDEGQVHCVIWIADSEDEESGPAFIFPESVAGDLSGLLQLLGAAEVEPEVAGSDNE